MGSRSTGSKSRYPIPTACLTFRSLASRVLISQTLWGAAWASVATLTYVPQVVRCGKRSKQGAFRDPCSLKINLSSFLAVKLESRV